MENNEKIITIPCTEYEAQKQQILRLEQQVPLLMEAIQLNWRKRFGTSSEKTEDESAEQLNFLFANTPKEATGSAAIFSIIQTAIENGWIPTDI